MRGSEAASSAGKGWGRRRRAASGGVTTGTMTSQVAARPAGRVEGLGGGELGREGSGMAAV